MGSSTQSIILADSAPPDRSGCLVDYEFRPAAASRWQSLDLRAVIAANEDRWLAQIDAWHRELSELGAAQTRWWWLLPASRLAVWYPFPLKPVIAAIAIAELAGEHRSDAICLIGAPDETAVYLAEWCGQHNLIWDDRRAARQKAEPRPSAFARWIRQARTVASLMARALSSDRPPQLSAGTLVWSHTLDRDLMGRVGDHFFGRMFDDPALQPAAGVAWCYQVTNFSDCRAVRRELANAGRRAVLDGDYFRVSDLRFVARAGREIGRALKQLRAAAPPLKVGRLASTAATRRFLDQIEDAGAPVNELLIYRSMSRTLDATGARALIYPYEEKGLERALLMAATERSPPVTTTAFAHAAYSKGHRFVRRAAGERQPRPGRLAVTGEAARRWFEQAGVPSTGILVIGSPRFRPMTIADTRRADGPLRLLLLVGFPSELRLFAQTARQCPALLGGAELRIRRYPFGWHDAQAIAESALRTAGVPFTIVEGDLGDAIHDTDVVLYSSTSAGVEAMLRGRAAVRLEVDDIVTVDPLCSLGNERSGIPSIRPADLATEVRRFASMSTAAWQDVLRSQYQAATRLYAAAQPEVIAEVLHA